MEAIRNYSIVRREREKGIRLSYEKVFWLFILGCVAGVIIEGMFCLITKGHWESHVVSVYGAYNLLYGAGAMLFYVGAYLLKTKPLAVKAAILMLVATILELLCGLFLRDFLGMRAWSYANSFLNYKGLICAGFSLIWGIAAFGFCAVYPQIDRFLSKLTGKGWRIACVAFTCFMLINFTHTASAIFRWADRHYGFQASSAYEQWVDSEAPDDWMKERFIEWRFIDE